MLGRLSFLISMAVICALGLMILFYTLFGVDDDYIEIEVSLVAAVALLVFAASLMLLILGAMVRIVARPWQSETFVAREDKEHLIENEDWVYQHRAHSSTAEMDSTDNP